MTPSLARRWCVAWLALGVLTACGQSSGSCRSCDNPPAVTPQAAPIVAIRQTSSPITIDGTLEEWGTRFVVLTIPPDSARDSQWECIRNRCAAPLSARDAGVTAYLAWSEDPFVLYAAFDLVDDVIVASRYPDRPYSGDCVEIFIAADDLDYTRDYRSLVEAPRSKSQSAFAQIDIGPASVAPAAYYVQDYRTDPPLKNALLTGGFSVATRRESSHWQTEVRIPLDAFAADIGSRLRTDGARLAIGLTYLDYDDAARGPDPRLAADSYGFKPDNVFSAAREESGIHVPARMGRTYLAR